MKKRILLHVLVQGLLLLLTYFMSLGLASFEDAGRHPLVGMLVIVYVFSALAAYGFIETLFNNKH